MYPLLPERTGCIGFRETLLLRQDTVNTALCACIWNYGRCSDKQISGVDPDLSIGGGGGLTMPTFIKPHPLLHCSCGKRGLLREGKSPLWIRPWIIFPRKKLTTLQEVDCCFNKVLLPQLPVIPSHLMFQK